MNRFLVILLFTASLAQAQPPQRVYRTGDNVVIFDSANVRQISSFPAAALVTATNGSIIYLYRSKNNPPFVFASPAKLLNASGAPYSTLNAPTAVSALLAAVASTASSGGASSAQLTQVNQRIDSLKNAPTTTFNPSLYALKTDIRTDIIRLSATDPTDGCNFYLNTVTGKLRYLSNTTWQDAVGGAGAATNSLNNGLVAAYTFDETSGNFADATGVHPATPQGTLVRGVSGHRGTAVNFSNGFAQVTGGAVLTGPSFSISAWVRISNGGSNRPIFATKNGDAGSLLVRLGGGNGPLALKEDSGPDYFDTPSTAPFGQNTHIVITYDNPSKLGQILIDDVVVASTTTTNSIAFAFGEIERIGSDGRGSNAEVIDDLVIANRAWTLAECHAIHTQNFVTNNPSAPFP